MLMLNGGDLMHVQLQLRLLEGRLWPTFPESTHPHLRRLHLISKLFQNIKLFPHQNNTKFDRYF